MNFFNFLKKELWAYVGCIEIPLHPPYMLYVHLYESSKGKRKISARSTYPADVNELLKSTYVYNTRLVRWVNGRIDPEILRYNQVSEDDIVNIVKGENY